MSLTPRASSSIHPTFLEGEKGGLFLMYCSHRKAIIFHSYQCAFAFWHPTVCPAMGVFLLYYWLESTSLCAHPFSSSPYSYRNFQPSSHSVQRKRLSIVFLFHFQSPSSFCVVYGPFSNCSRWESHPWCSACFITFVPTLCFYVPKGSDTCLSLFLCP